MTQCHRWLHRCRQEAAAVDCCCDLRTEIWRSLYVCEAVSRQRGSAPQPPWCSVGTQSKSSKIVFSSTSKAQEKQEINKTTEIASSELPFHPKNCYFQVLLVNSISTQQKQSHLGTFQQGTEFFITNLFAGVERLFYRCKHVLFIQSTMHCRSHDPG